MARKNKRSQILVLGVLMLAVAVLAGSGLFSIAGFPIAYAGCTATNMTTNAGINAYKIYCSQSYITPNGQSATNTGGTYSYYTPVNQTAQYIKTAIANNNASQATINTAIKSDNTYVSNCQAALNSGQVCVNLNSYTATLQADQASLKLSQNLNAYLAGLISMSSTTTSSTTTASTSTTSTSTTSTSTTSTSTTTSTTSSTSTTVPSTTTSTTTIPSGCTGCSQLAPNILTQIVQAMQQFLYGILHPLGLM